MHSFELFKLYIHTDSCCNKALIDNNGPFCHMPACRRMHRPQHILWMFSSQIRSKLHDLHNNPFCPFVLHSPCARHFPDSWRVMRVMEFATRLRAYKFDVRQWSGIATSNRSAVFTVAFNHSFVAGNMPFLSSYPQFIPSSCRQTAKFGE